MKKLLPLLLCLLYLFGCASAAQQRSLKDLPGGDFRTLMTSINEQILTLPDETILYSGHGPATSVGRERAGNPFLTGMMGLSG